MDVDAVGCNDMKILYLLADLRTVGPTRQTLNIIKYSGVKDSCVVLTMFDEPQETLIDLYLDAGIRVECLHLNRRMFVFKAVRKIADFCVRNNIEAIHSYGVKPDIVAHFVAKKIGVKHIITLRNFPMEDLTGRMNPLIGKVIARFHLFALKRCKYLIACSKTIAEKMSAAYGVDITPIQNGVDTTLFKKASHDSRNAFCEKFGIGRKSKVFICTNSFIARKHNDEIARAFLDANIEDAELFFLGDGPLFESITHRYSRWSQIHFMGKRPDVAHFLQNSDVFVSASDSEGLPNAVLEALACGCSVVLSDIPQHKEILDYLPNCGKLFALHDKEALSTIMRTVADDKMSSADVSMSIADSPLTMVKMGELYGKYYRKMQILC